MGRRESNGGFGNYSFIDTYIKDLLRTHSKEVGLLPDHQNFYLNAPNAACRLAFTEDLCALFPGIPDSRFPGIPGKKAFLIPGNKLPNFPGIWE